MNEADLDRFRNSPLGQRLMHKPGHTPLPGGNNYDYLSRMTWMVVRSSLSKEEEGVRVQDEYRLQSTICSRYYMEDEYHIIPIEAIAGPAFVCMRMGQLIQATVFQEVIR